MQPHIVERFKEQHDPPTCGMLSIPQGEYVEANRAAIGCRAGRAGSVLPDKEMCLGQFIEDVSQELRSEVARIQIQNKCRMLVLPFGSHWTPLLRLYLLG